MLLNDGWEPVHAFFTRQDAVESLERFEGAFVKRRIRRYQRAEPTPRRRKKR